MKSLQIEKNLRYAAISTSLAVTVWGHFPVCANLAQSSEDGIMGLCQAGTKFQSTGKNYEISAN